MDFNRILAEKARLIEEALDRYLPPEFAPPHPIHQSMRYSVLGGGKRLRPALLLGAAEAVGADVAEDLLLAACGIELIHCYSLVHDDLPAMDNDDFRRGRPTSHRVFGEAIAILTGDALLTLGFELLARAALVARQGSEVGLRVIVEVARAAGSEGMVGGQVLDLGGSKNADPALLLEEIHRKKTGALFVAAVRAGALLGGAQEEALQKLTLYAEELGLAFQIVDDILDLDEEAKLSKLTYPAVFGLPAARARAEEAVKKALSALDSFGPEADFLRQAAEFVLSRKS
ncbi:Polyprenyl synthetase [Ammonifex degensii KC4]|uniref:Farnesyl diphosphate synthase n=1 Tax=Ammonifex degensii (strain DSM 10501 / KC4) TaxID=429009 RepID=C9R873_AMMDK|nr:farnesyl diphosphate synthase [Ammonifex degensii]ACX52502.1 Polyprenyl synthetase [Ammonifex degensii KC4]